MYRFALFLATSAVLTLGLTAPCAALAGQGLTPVQEAFINRRPLFLLAPPPDAPTLTVQSQRPAPPAQSAMPKPRAASPDRGSPDFRPAKFSKVLTYALQLSFYECVMRVAAQGFTREQLGGPFFQDWFDSVKIPKTWDDGDSWEVNTIGHAIHGSAGARIWLDQREPKTTTKKQYFASMGRAFLFSVVFSVQYEIGPLSEASIGNVGMRPGETGWIDHVWTPFGAVLWAMVEDGIDKYFLAQVDKHVPFVIARAMARMILNPGRMLANIGQNHLPWYRADRPITGSGR